MRHLLLATVATLSMSSASAMAQVTAEPLATLPFTVCTYSDPIAKVAHSEACEAVETADGVVLVFSRGLRISLSVPTLESFSQLSLMTVNGHMGDVSRIRGRIAFMPSDRPGMKLELVGVSGPRLTQLSDEASSHCRGGPGDQPITMAHCDLAERYFIAAKSAGWCNGRQGEAEHQNRWHRCDSTSN